MANDDADNIINNNAFNVTFLLRVHDWLIEILIS